MRSKERVLTAFLRKEPDRVPINYLANIGIDRRLKEYYGLPIDDHESLRQKLGVDFRSVAPVYKGPRLHGEIEGLNVDPAWGFRTKVIEHSSGTYQDFCDFPLKNADMKMVSNWPMPSADDFDYEQVLTNCREYSEYATHIGLVGTSALGDIINTTGMLMSMETVLMGLAVDDRATLMMIDKRLEIQFQVVKRCIEIANGKIDFLWLGDDLGTQYSPMISMDMFRRHIRPRHQKFIDLAKRNGLKIMFHSCGSSSWAFDDFAEMGIDAVDTLQPEAKDMSPEYLKKRYGDKLAFHGCISTAGPLAYGSVEDVVEYTRQTLNIMMPGGGYCVCSTHAIQDNSPTENVVAMYETARAFGGYK